MRTAVFVPLVGIWAQYGVPNKKSGGAKRVGLLRSSKWPAVKPAKNAAISNMITVACLSVIAVAR